MGTPDLVAPAERPTLTDGRVLLRPPAPADRDAVYDAVIESRDEVGRWMGWCHPGYAVKDTEEWLAACEVHWASANGERTFVAVDAGSGELLGCTGINQFNRVHKFANLGYWIRTRRARQGLTSASARLVARYGFEALGLARIEIVMQVANGASRRVAEKVGCTFEGIARARLEYRGEHLDAAMYSLLPGDLR